MSRVRFTISGEIAKGCITFDDVDVSANFEPSTRDTWECPGDPGVVEDVVVEKMGAVIVCDDDGEEVEATDTHRAHIKQHIESMPDDWDWYALASEAANDEYEAAQEARYDAWKDER